MRAPSFQDTLTILVGNQQLKAALAHTYNELMSQPLHNPRLETHRVERAPGERWTSHVGSDGHRLIWQLVDGRMVLLLLLGTHDAVYRRAERMQVAHEPRSGAVEIREIDPETGAQAPYVDIRSRAGALFMAWTDAELRAAGLEAHEVDVLRGLSSLDDLDRVRDHMRPGSYDLALRVAVDGLHTEPERDPVAVAPVDGQELLMIGLAESIEAQPLHAGFLPANVASLDSIRDQPIEDWMIFLHPDQARAVEVDFNGPARIRGSAGTGKTVVGLHRAHRMAREKGSRILFTTYIRTLPPVLASLYERMPLRGDGTVEFVNLHAWARRFLTDRGQQPNIDVQQAASCFATAWNKVEAGLRRSGLSRSYFQDEICWIIKGRRIQTLGEYTALERTGRGTPLEPRLRSVVWDLHERYKALLASNHLVDFDDLLSMALAELERTPLEKYDAVLVDEAQDLTEVGLRIVSRLAPSSNPNGLVLLGDGRQKVYPGGFSLRRIGIDIAGRAAVLRLNYRNSRQVLALAEAVIGGEPPAGLEDESDSDLLPQAVRIGDPPVAVGFVSQVEQDLALTIDVQERSLRHGVGPGDVAVLVPTNRQAQHYIKLIEELGLRAQNLDKYDGHPNPLVKVGTYQRSKGLEFKYVFLPDLHSSGIGEARNYAEDEVAYQERLSLLRRLIYVAIARARDGVWLGWVGQPSSIIANAVRHLSAE